MIPATVWIWAISRSFLRRLRSRLRGGLRRDKFDKLSLSSPCSSSSSCASSPSSLSSFSYANPKAVILDGDYPTILAPIAYSHNELITLCLLALALSSTDSLAFLSVKLIGVVTAWVGKSFLSSVMSKLVGSPPTIKIGIVVVVVACGVIRALENPHSRSINALRRGSRFGRWREDEESLSLLLTLVGVLKPSASGNDGARCGKQLSKGRRS